MTPTDVVQPILILKATTHEDAVLNAARASVAAFVEQVEQGSPDPMWDLWLEGRFTKTVRRAGQALLTEAEGLGGVRVGDAVAMSPRPYEVFPRPVRRAQASGTVFERVGAPGDTDEGPTLVVLETLTTGKAAAQAAHALWLWAIPLLVDSPESITHWRSQGMPVGLRLVSALDLEAQAGSVDEMFRVVDAGLTKISPHTLTAIAVDA